VRRERRRSVVGAAAPTRSSSWIERSSPLAGIEDVQRAAPRCRPRAGVPSPRPSADSPPAAPPAWIATSIGRRLHESGRADARARRDRRRAGARRRCGRSLSARRDRGARSPRPCGCGGARETADDVAGVLAWCYEHDVPLTPRGGGSGYAGGAVPDGGVVVALAGLRSVRSIEPLQWRAEIESGVHDTRGAAAGARERALLPARPRRGRAVAAGRQRRDQRRRPARLQIRRHRGLGDEPRGRDRSRRARQVRERRAQGRGRLRRSLVADRLGGDARDRDGDPAEADPAAGGTPPRRGILRRRHGGHRCRHARDGERDAARRDRVPGQRGVRNLRPWLPVPTHTGAATCLRRHRRGRRQRGGGRNRADAAAGSALSGSLGGGDAVTDPRRSPRCGVGATGSASPPTPTSAARSARMSACRWSVWPR
jgi:hypothetical protein